MLAKRASTVSSFMAIKGALIDSTYAIFRHWDLAESKKRNLDRMKQSDPAGAGSANWWRDLAKVTNRRFDTEGRDRILVEMAQAETRLEVWRPLLLWHMTRDEFMVRDFLVNWLYPLHASGSWRVRTDGVEAYLAQLQTRPEVAIKGAWSPATSNRVASGLLSLAVDFGLLKGTTTRVFDSYHLPDQALLYLLHAMSEAEPNAHRMVHSPDWRMYLLSADDVERELFRLHQLGQLRYEVAGSIAELRLPYATAADFARKELLP